MLDYLKSINRSERTALIIGAVFVSCFLIYLIIFAPLHNSINNKQNILEDKIQTLNWMQQASREYLQLRKTKPQQSTKYSNESLLTIIDRTTEKLRVRSFIRRIDPEGENRVQIWLERINFDDLIQLLNILQRNHNIGVENISVNRQSDQALVDARVTVIGKSQ